jgi:hypothetical protein
MPVFMSSQISGQESGETGFSQSQAMRDQKLLSSRRELALFKYTAALDKRLKMRMSANVGKKKSSSSGWII